MLEISSNGTEKQRHNGNNNSYICFTLLKLANDLGMGPNNWFWSTCNLFKF
jgi:hypothetical protein